MKLETATPSYVRLEYKLPSKIYAQKPCSTCLRAERQAIMELTAAVCTFLMRRRFKKLLLKQPFVSEKKKTLKYLANAPQRIENVATPSYDIVIRIAYFV